MTWLAGLLGCGMRLPASRTSAYRGTVDTKIPTHDDHLFNPFDFRLFGVLYFPSLIQCPFSMSEHTSQLHRMNKSLLRKRSSSVHKVFHNIDTRSHHHLTGSFLPPTYRLSKPARSIHVLIIIIRPTETRTPTPDRLRFKLNNDEFYRSKGLWNDFKTLRWMRLPSSSFKMLMIPVVLYVFFAILAIEPNPIAPLLFISYPIENRAIDDPRYAKGWLDIAFITYHIIVFSFIRQFTILKIIFPVARYLGIKKQAKLDRFGEQAYAMLYYGAMGFWGLYIMSKLPTWWYRTENFWIGYPHWDLKPALKRYYLMHLSYWIQQLIVLALKIEKPRNDFHELVAHHIVTLWLIGWSYGINMTLIGNAVFVSMDIPDTFLALSKLLNYLNLERTKAVSFVFFIGIWTYFRHYLNVVMLHSIWTEFDLIPDEARFFRPSDGVWMAGWMKYQIFTPVLLLQFLNLFWYFLILRILYRTLTGSQITDVRSDDEDDGNDEKED
ncbi:hypothetical protein EW145_g2568 [Phellinidium pouzarii]|uniref:TLC domain-containing protein n=1 Tax=Phellinidium pouzarii TaxID=167371 RepID=A0A4S4LAM6_9AGAM|nr:hypothetical protein EW145_g2568 [Phellinidium pouzarii]